MTQPVGHCKSKVIQILSRKKSRPYISESLSSVSMQSPTLCLTKNASGSMSSRCTPPSGCSGSMPIPSPTNKNGYTFSRQSSRKHRMRAECSRRTVRATHVLQVNKFKSSCRRSMLNSDRQPRRRSSQGSSSSGWSTRTRTQEMTQSYRFRHSHLILSSCTRMRIFQT